MLAIKLRQYGEEILKMTTYKDFITTMKKTDLEY